MTFDPGVNLIVGDNAQGKTNLLESLVYLSQGSSYRTRREDELIRWNQDYARMEAEIRNARRDVDLVYVLYRGPRRRQILLNGVKQKNAAEAEDSLTTVLFCPEDLQILRAGASVRRRFLDSAISQLRPKYKKAVSDYQKLYESKSRILRDHFMKPGLLETLPDFNRQMAIVGAVVIVGCEFIRGKGIGKLVGLWNLYGTTSYLADILSYSRLLALGLASAVIAQVFNMLGRMMGKSVVGIIAFVLIIVIGHTVNFAINALGSFVHASRLQYVEFFGKFYEGGGTPFKPLERKTKYVNLVKEEK